MRCPVCEQDLEVVVGRQEVGQIVLRVHRCRGCGGTFLSAQAILSPEMVEEVQTTTPASSLSVARLLVSAIPSPPT